MLLLFFVVVFHLSCVSNGILLQELFPYGNQVNDSILTGNVGPIDLPYEFYYFDNPYRKISITDNGVFSFELSNLGSFNFPQSLSKLNNKTLISAYWYSSQSNLNNRNQISYQIHSNSSSNISLKVFNKVNDYIRRYFSREYLFESKLVIIGTWYNISNSNLTNSNVSLYNTFQTVLSTDGDRSFVFYLYNKLEWSNNDNNTYAGFHNGKMNGSISLKYSGTNQIIKLINESNVNVKGLFVYRVDTNQINAGGCNNDNTTTKFSFRPRIVSQLGSTPLIISGPCFPNGTEIRCRFGLSGPIVIGFVVDYFRSICVTPFLSVDQSLTVYVSINNQIFIFAGNLILNPLKLTSDEISVQIQNRNLYYGN